MGLTRVLLISACLFAASLPAWGQAANSSSTSSQPGILGYLDARTGAFRPVPAPALDDDAEAAAATTVGGTVTVTFTITVKTTGLTVFICSAEVSTLDAGTMYDESASVPATGSGATRTCKVSIPYSWSLTAAASDTMSTVYTVIGSGATGAQRSSLRNPLDKRKVPANGATTALTAAVTQ